MNFLSLNIQGLAQKAKRDWVRELCVKHSVNVLALQETKLEFMDQFTVKYTCGNFAFDFVHSDSFGNSGGILCAWDSKFFHKVNSITSDYYVILSGVWLQSNTNMLIIVVYAPHDKRERRTLWEHLCSVVNKWKGEVVMMGDFNEVRLSSERFGSVFHYRNAELFNNFIHNAGLEEVP